MKIVTVHVCPLIPEHRIFSLGKATLKFRSLTQATR
jgi:hypothetical protein